jgi:excisionase family DNA binding protein
MDVLTVKEAAEALRCSVRHTHRLFVRGEVEGYRVGDSPRIYARSVEEYKQRHSNKKAPVVTVQPLQSTKTEARKQGRQRRPLPPTEFRHLQL